MASYRAHAETLSGDQGSSTSFPGALPATGGDFATMFVFHKVVAAGVGGGADDVLLTSNTPFKMRVFWTQFKVTTNAGGSTCTLRTAPAGGGTALSDSFSTASTGMTGSAETATNTVAAGSSLYLRRSNNTVAGEVIMMCVPSQ